MARAGMGAVVLSVLLALTLAIPEAAAAQGDLARDGWMLALLGQTIGLALASSLVAAPFGIGAALHWFQFSDEPRWRQTFELFALLPSVIYGYVGLHILPGAATTSHRWWLTVLLLGLYLSVPLALASHEMLRVVPLRLRQAALSLGARRSAVLLHVVLPVAKPGLAAVVLLALARALSEATLIAMLLGFEDRSETTMAAALLGELGPTAQVVIASVLCGATLACHLRARALLRRMRQGGEA